MIGIYTIEIPIRPTTDVGSEIIPAAFTETHTSLRCFHRDTDAFTGMLSFHRDTHFPGALAKSTQVFEYFQWSSDLELSQARACIMHRLRIRIYRQYLPVACCWLVEGIESWRLSRIELWSLSIEPSWVNDFELRGIDAPLIEGDLQPVEYGWQCTINVSALIAANITTGLVDECQVFFEVEQNT